MSTIGLQYHIPSVGVDKLNPPVVAAVLPNLKPPWLAVPAVAPPRLNPPVDWVVVVVAALKSKQNYLKVKQLIIPIHLKKHSA